MPTFLTRLSLLAGTTMILSSQIPAQPAAVKIPDPPRDFRGAWVATVSNIDWPSKRGLTTEQQQAELLAIFDQARELHLNAIILQIRPTMDAFYKSDLEPWSIYLTGKSGQAPEPFYDPLEFAVTEAHKRGLQLHAWFNPYRAHFKGEGPTENLAENHVARAKNFVREYGTHYWMDPTDDEALKHNIAVFKDVVARYDIDGVHMDDYFYPYPEKDNSGREIPFPDDANWQAYKKSGGTLSRDDWRRSKVNNLVQSLGKAIKEVRPTVQYGISPFGIWRPGHPEGIAGLDQYNVLYADAKLWLNEGWVDYFTPQLYWRIQDLQQSYPHLLRWWMGENTQNRHIWPGLFTSKIGTKPRDYASDEIVNQIVLTRFLGATGNIHFSFKAFQNNPQNLNEKLTTSTSVYAGPALPPPSPWLDDVPPSAPTDLKAEVVTGDDGTTSLRATWNPGGNYEANPEDRPFVWAVYARTAGRWQFHTYGAPQIPITLPANDKGVLPDLIAVAATDRLGNISPWTTLATGAATAAETPKETFGQVQ